MPIFNISWNCACFLCYIFVCQLVHLAEVIQQYLSIVANNRLHCPTVQRATGSFSQVFFNTSYNFWQWRHIIPPVPISTASSRSAWTRCGTIYVRELSMCMSVKAWRDSASFSCIRKYCQSCIPTQQSTGDIFVIVVAGNDSLLGSFLWLRF